MRQRFTCEAVARRVLGPPVKTRAAEIFFRCKYREKHRHGDANPSLQVNTGKDCFTDGPCGVSGTAWELAAFLAGLQPDDKPAVTSWLRSHGLLNRKREIVAVYE